MGRIGNETNHFLDGLTVRGGFEAENINVGANATVRPHFLNVFASQIFGSYNPPSAVAFGANQAKAARAIVPRDGLIVEVAVFVVASSGNLDVGIYDCSATNRVRLYSSGSTATGSATTWQSFTLATPLSVFRGQHLDLAVASDNGTTTLLGSQNIGSNNASAWPSAAWMPVFTDAAGTVAGSTVARYLWAITTAFPLPNPAPEASMGVSAAAPMVFCRLA